MNDHEKRDNPLCGAILKLLRLHSQGMREFDMLAALAEHELIKSLPEDSELGLFQKHFILMNALYQLQDSLWRDESLVLTISPLHIQLRSQQQINAGDLPDAESLVELKEYYLDWGNYERTTKSDVQNLLSDFWRRYINVDAREAALSTLDLPIEASKSDIARRYRELAAVHHPDKGGKPEIFIQIREAYEVLK